MKTTGNTYATMYSNIQAANMLLWLLRGKVPFSVEHTSFGVRFELATEHTDMHERDFRASAQLAADGVIP